MTHQGTHADASEWSVALLAALISQGVRHVVVCPGSRSQALALAAATAENAGAIDLHVRLDERSAAFFALGIARETGIPAPVIVTSGTAVANLLPAALEAHEARVPLLLLTADRPAELRGIRSSQTTQQRDLFASCARMAVDQSAPEYFGDTTAQAQQCAASATGLADQAMRAALGTLGALPAGPVHLNLSFREPLSGTVHSADHGFEAMRAAAATRDDSATPMERNGAETAASDDLERNTYVHRGDSFAVVVAGAGAGEAAESFARAAGLPLLAEVTSGARFGREAIVHYAALIERADIGALIEQVIVFGHPTLTRQVPAIIRRPDIRTIVIDPYSGDGIDHYAPAPTVRRFAAARVAPDHEPAEVRRWLGLWVRADRELIAADEAALGQEARTLKDADFRELSSYTRQEIAQQRAAVTRESLVNAVWRATWPHDRLVLAASRLIRVLDRSATPRRITVQSNRGLAGIDGTIATASGIASASQARADRAAMAGTTRLIIGDIALLHDAGSLLQPVNETPPRLQIIVGNDTGGTIFDTLEAADTAPTDSFDRVMLTPHQVDLAALAAAYGWHYVRVASQGELDSALAQPVTGPTLIEVPLQR